MVFRRTWEKVKRDLRNWIEAYIKTINHVRKYRK